MVTFQRRSVERAQWFTDGRGNALCAKCALLGDRAGITMCDVGEELCDFCGETRSAIIVDGIAAIESAAGARIF